MHAELLITSVLFFGVFLAVTAILQPLSRWIHFPYTVALLLVGFGMQLVMSALGIHQPIDLSSDVIYFILLPLLLYESAFHINVHQFQLQFWTITFLSTFGVLLAAGTVAFVLAQFIGLSFVDSLLFGALISATDPIAVLAIFKELGAPKRLGLLAEGESMFNDATAVILFRVVASFAVAENAFRTFDVFYSVAQFSYVFVGSLLFGVIAALITARFIANIVNDRLVETTLTIALALIVFVFSEHTLGLSGVIATVAAGITMGNMGRPKISGSVVQFMQEFWEYIGFMGVSLVFFFAAFKLDLDLMLSEPLTMTIVIAAVLLSRAVSVYGTFAVTNNLSLFKREPNVPLSWQHVMNWGGLRGVIPLVLVYSLPDTYALKEVFIAFTMANFLFSLLINATTIRPLLMWLGLHLPKREEAIIAEENRIFTLEEAREHLNMLPSNEFSPLIVQEITDRIDKEELTHRKNLLELVTPRELEKSLRIEVIAIERRAIERLFLQNHINERVLSTFTAELDLQQDAIEYPELSVGRGYEEGGKLDSQQKFRGNLQTLREAVRQFPLFAKFFRSSRNRLVVERMALLQARIVASSEAIEYLEHVQTILGNSLYAQMILREVISEHEQFRLKNSFQMQALSREYPRRAQDFERQVIESLAWSGAQRPTSAH